ncbi:dTDP-glucose 4,6-dehydratase [Methanothermobacter tenebrarum]|jgi:dTDP-glucose 4,6-dehydratase|uniref:dTDP-glucose 4,6-dehydratase n=1 Tax=Methanothermobacter tenebrarum TaxID=680118 RepID=A0ABN6PFW1_9EURY|nr:dTDP-glucose 4,6-dehydratase [Methanothermobacter tenebrarum]MDD3455203.1 dTDP-glucose 4,6-dehydratase [Methanobacteriales archaeon]MDI6881547.1 dTDP-glucose 4,6-dehydratase [Methanothermobacter sp.]MDX9693041.1 dTDP-glucose 4,6-dehydratase [Methanothermobacter sp.]BDH79824.1 dTDP-glucose 4,6-dehydratase [Methanothermobacter tenebrarum]HOQ19876.1 dTDP-glucose 4,6-dehydratase [Methanothermobacter sp.]
MRIIVTGGAGFIGSNFIKYMLKEHPQYEIINLDALTYCGNLENLQGVEDNPNYKFVKGDITDKRLVDDLTQGADVIINFAAESHVDRSIQDPSKFLKTNVIGTQTLLEAAKKHNIQKYIQISTDEVYGSCEKCYFTEETPLAPNSPYAASKASADLFVRAYHKTYNLPVNITRSSNNYGPYQFPEKFIPLIITNALENKPIPIYGDGMNIRDWIHVYDHCRAIDLVLHHGRQGEIYNIGGGNEKRNIEVVKLILEILGKDESLIRFVEDRPGHDRRYAMDSKKIKRELGWKPTYKFREGLEETIKWYTQNRRWWENIKTGEYQEYYEKMYGKRLYD